MDLIEGIRSRRMLPRVGSEAPPRQAIEELLELAVRAPNHFRTEPWRFTVVRGDERWRIARAIAEEEIESKGTDRDEALAGAWKKVDRAPVIVVFTCRPADDPRVVEQEELCSVAMALENFLLGVHAKGLGAMLRTGAAAYHPAMARELGLEPGEFVVGMVYLGFPEADREPTPRAPASERTTWLGWQGEPGL